MPDTRARQRTYVDPLDLRDAREPAVRTVSPVLLVVGPIVAISWLAALALVVGIIGGAWLALTVLLAGPSSLGGFFIAITEPPGSPGRRIGHALMAIAAITTAVLLAFQLPA